MGELPPLPWHWIQFASIIGLTFVAKVISAQASGSSSSIVASSTFVKQEANNTDSKRIKNYFLIFKLFFMLIGF